MKIYSVQFCFWGSRLVETSTVLMFCCVCTTTQVEGLMRLMEGDHVGPFNLGNPGEFTMLELAEVNLQMCR